MERMEPRARSDAYGSRINRSHSSVLANIVPWASILAASLVPVFFIASALPLLAPLGFAMLLGWRLVRPGLLPVWAGLPLGLFDDLFSGQPFGYAIFTWSVALLVIEAIELRMPWRSFSQDWLTASAALIGYIGLGWLLSGGEPTVFSLVALVPQLAISVILFPTLARLCAALDRLRLSRWRRV
ncbi:rod shape-determining protein MreD [Erythrobacter litoralis]|uniref:rod shape-determining protein MreD n=1 Tax=Erythrobacter litoralis TaxID=39960 RepID=UPI002435A1FB|nr:rod shape-determining protein MreD [Erythrobacter litoralis]MDG6079569.1 rod shape-determining protein MreD [Erythrobacter litoralis]